MQSKMNLNRKSAATKDKALMETCYALISVQADTVFEVLIECT